MDTVVITSEQDISLDAVRSQLAPYWRLLDTPAEKLAIQEDNSRVYIYHPNLDSGEANLKVLFLDYSSMDLVKRIVQLIGDDARLQIDNDFKTVLPGDQFIARLRSEPAWDWRLE
jgi:hypothetical protein